MPGTTQNIIWLDDETKRIKYATHARFDEGMNDVPINKIPPNVQLLQRSEYGKRPAKDHLCYCINGTIQRENTYFWHKFSLFLA